jgi:hypothetical protein
VVVAVSITAITLAKIATDSFHTYNSATQSSGTEKPELKTTVQDSDTNPNVNGDPVITNQLGLQYADPSPFDHPLARYIYDSSPIVLPITWGAVAGTIIWRGKTRSKWSRQGYDYDTFRLVSKMRGSPTRIRLLNAVRDERKNKLQRAKALDVDWKTGNNHTEMLLQARLIEESGVVGTARYYSITENGRKILSLLAAEELEE